MAPKSFSPRRSRDKRLFFTSKPSEISTKGPVIVTIGTPVDEFLNPERKSCSIASIALLPHLRDGQLLVLRSTLYPGTTDWIDDHLKQPRPQAQGRVLPGAHRAGLRHRGVGAGCRRSSAAPRPRPRRKPRRCFSRSTPELVHRQADRGRVRQAVQQRLPLYRIRRDQPVLSDREVGGARLQHASCAR